MAIHMCREKCTSYCGTNPDCITNCCRECCKNDDECFATCTSSLDRPRMYRIVAWLLTHDRCPFCGMRVKWMHADVKPDGSIVITDFECPRCGLFTLKNGKYVRLKPGKLRYRILDALKTFIPRRLQRWTPWPTRSSRNTHTK